MKADKLNLKEKYSDSRFKDVFVLGKLPLQLLQSELILKRN